MKDVEFFAWIALVALGISLISIVVALVALSHA